MLVALAAGRGTQPDREGPGLTVKGRGPHIEPGHVGFQHGRSRLGRSGKAMEVAMGPGTLTVALVFGRLIVTRPARWNIARPSTRTLARSCSLRVHPSPFVALPWTPGPSVCPVASSPSTPTPFVERDMPMTP